MRRKGILLLVLLLAACGGSSHQPPAPVLNLGLHADSSAGAMIVGETDTLWNISRRYRLPVRDIIDLNDLQPPYALAKGQRLKLPPPVDYRVSAGDSLDSIANMFGVGMSRLVSVNRLAVPYTMRVGMVLRIPSSVKERVAAAPVVAAAPAPAVTREKLSPLSPPKPVHRVRTATTTMALTTAFPHFIWPVHGKIISAYGAKESGLYNDGINIAVPRGTPVAAAADGIVAYVGHDLKSYGNLVLIRHGTSCLKSNSGAGTAPCGATMTAYAHLGSVTAKKGMAIRKGQPIGLVGATGDVSSAQLHFEIRQESRALNPQQYLG